MLARTFDHVTAVAFITLASIVIYTENFSLLMVCQQMKPIPRNWSKRHGSPYRYLFMVCRFQFQLYVSACLRELAWQWYQKPVVLISRLAHSPYRNRSDWNKALSIVINDRNESRRTKKYIQCNCLMSALTLVLFVYIVLENEDFPSLHILNKSALDTSKQLNSQSRLDKIG